jgi:GT2 family glycosyltransferase/Flp pilus assembly protein TadD
MEKPIVISVLTLNNLKLTSQCLESIFENTTIPYRVCVVDQASTDGTKEYLDGLEGRIDVVRSPENIGFIGGNNLVMGRYPESDILLLNNDTIVKKGWLRALRDCAQSDPAIGIVGAKLLYPDGRLQEAGGEIFHDGSGRNIGKNDDPQRHIYNLRRDVDYCSGACLFAKREVLDGVGYLDPIFNPAYWEDTDLCFRARKAGYRVVYEPTAEIIHLEGGTSGSPYRNSLSRKLQDRNKPKFMERWGQDLNSHRKNVFEVRTSGGKEKILVILPFLPMYDRAAGEKRWFHTLKILTRHFDVVFLARNGAGQLKYINELERMGITVFHTDQARLEQMGCDVKGPLWIDFPLLLRTNDFKAVIVGFYHMAHQYYRDVRTHSPQTVFIIDSYDLCFVRERRRADLTGDPKEIWKALEIKRQELSMYRRADMVLTVTEEDRRRLHEELPDLSVGISTDIHPAPDTERAGQGQDLVFVGNYNHDPNEDAVLYFAREIFPKVKRSLPQVKLYVVGNSPTEDIEALASDDIIVTGFVPEVTPYLLESRVFIVPLRYGAGLKGKIGEALACGIPIVTTSIGAEGMHLVHGKNAMIGDDPDDFARSVADVYTESELWQRLSSEGKAHARRNYSQEAVENYWKEIIEFIHKGPRPIKERPKEELSGLKRIGPVPEIVPDVAVIVPVHNNLAYTRRCWTSIRKNTETPRQVIIVDNGSTEDVAYEADENNLEVIRNETNLGFAWACNQGIRHTHGDFVCILNNDTIVTPGWLEHLLWHLRDQEVGIVAPSTNFAASIQQIPVSYKSERELYTFAEELHSRNRHQSTEADKVTGVCMVIRRKMLEEIGLFDTRFGLGNYEDDDLCLRARIAGYKVLWAKDVFVHHSGSKTFQAIGVDYGGLMRQNREKYISKWKAVTEEFAAAEPVTAVPRPDGVGPPVFLMGGGEGMALTIESSEHDSGPATFVLTDLNRGEDALPEATMICGSESQPLARRVVDHVERSNSDTVFFVRSGVILTPNWMTPLERALADERIGCVVSASNTGWGGQITPPQYRKTGKPLARFARRNAHEHRGKLVDIEMGLPVALAVRRKTLLESGLPREFVTDAMLLELQRKILDTGLRLVCAKDSYVHAEESPSPHRPEQEAVLHLLKGRKAVASGEIDLALKHLDQAAISMPDYVEALYERGILRSLKEMDEAAIGDFEKVIEVMPADSRAHNNLGCLYFKRNRIDLAERSFKRAIEADEANWEAKKNLADLYIATGKAGPGAALYSSIIQEYGDCPEVHTSLGDMYANHGDLETAKQLFKTALKMSPDNQAARDGLRAIALSEGNLRSAGGKGVGIDAEETVSMHDSTE